MRILMLCVFSERYGYKDANQLYVRGSVLRKMPTEGACKQPALRTEEGEQAGCQQFAWTFQTVHMPAKLARAA